MQIPERNSGLKKVNKQQLIVSRVLQLQISIDCLAFFSHLWPCFSTVENYYLTVIQLGIYLYFSISLPSPTDSGLEQGPLHVDTWPNHQSAPWQCACQPPPSLATCHSPWSGHPLASPATLASNAETIESNSPPVNYGQNTNILLLLLLWPIMLLLRRNFGLFSQGIHH